MTELVTLNAAREAQQLAILAQRSDVAPREQHQSSIQISHAGVDPDVKRSLGHAEAGAQGDQQADVGARRERNDAGLTGPSRPRIEIRSFEPAPREADKKGPTNTNVVADVTVAPTPTPAPQPTVTVGGDAGVSNSLATSPVLNGRTQAEVEVAIAQQAVQTAAFGQSTTAETDVRAARMEAAARAVRATATVRYGSSLAPTPEAAQQKFSDKAAAAEGYTGGGEQVQQKYYGKGSEAVVGQFARPDQPKKYSERAAENEQGTSFEDGSGEAKYYDKVAQTETDFAGGDTDEQKTMYERAQEVTQALREGETEEEARSKYSDKVDAQAPEKETVSVTIQGQPVTIQVTA